MLLLAKIMEEHGVHEPDYARDTNSATLALFTRAYPTYQVPRPPSTATTMRVPRTDALARAPSRLGRATVRPLGHLRSSWWPSAAVSNDGCSGRRSLSWVRRTTGLADTQHSAALTSTIVSSLAAVVHKLQELRHLPNSEKLPFSAALPLRSTTWSIVQVDIAEGQANAGPSLK